MNGAQLPPSAPTGFTLVPTGFLRALLHDSNCSYEAWARADSAETAEMGQLAFSDQVGGCPHPDHGRSFGVLRQELQDRLG